MNGIALVLVGLHEDLSIAVDEVAGVLLEKTLNSDVEFLVPLHRLGIMEHCGHQVSVLDVHVLESIALLLLIELIEEGLLPVDTFDVKNRDEALVTAFVAHEVVHIPT